MSGYQGETRRTEGLGFLPWSNAVHWDRERRIAYDTFLRDGLPAGFASEDGAALHFVGTELAQVVASRRSARAYRLQLRDDRVVETRLATRYLGDQAVVPLVPDGEEQAQPLSPAWAAA